MNEITPQAKRPIRYISIIINLLILIGIYLTSLYSYLLFHSIAELFSITIAFAIFIIGWNSRKYIENYYFLFLGIMYLFVGVIDLIHTLSYKGMGVFPEYGTNLCVQLWIFARYFESLSLLFATFFIGKKNLRHHLLFYGNFVVIGFFILTIFYWQIFPLCFIEGVGLTPFKIISEYVIVFILVFAIILIHQKRKTFDKKVYSYTIFAILTTIFAELAFTLYVDVYGFFNMVGHLCKIISFYFVYKAIVETGLRKPYSTIFRDLNEYKDNLMDSEEKLKVLNIQVEQKINDRELLLDKLQSSLEFKSKFLANMSHELRTPLNAILGFSQLLLENSYGELNINQKEFLTDISTAGNHLLSLINSILDLSKIEAGKLVLKIEAIKINELVNEINGVLKPLYLSNEIDFIVKGITEGDIVFADPLRLKQILYNLLSNGVKFTKKGSISLILNQHDSYSEFQIIDTGIGIEKNNYDVVFREFGRIENDRMESIQGAGLGLALTKRLVNLHGGKIWFKSEFKKGTTFFFTIPKINVKK